MTLLDLGVLGTSAKENERRLRDGHVVNPAILAFQGRSPQHPHEAA